MGYERSGHYYRDVGDRGFGVRGRDDHYRDREDWREREHRGRSRPFDHDDDRGFFERAGDELRSWFGDEEAERRRRWDERRRDREDERYERERYGGARAGAYGYGYGHSPDVGTRYGYRADWGAGRGAGATMNYGLGAGPDHDDWGDSNYRAWRRRQIEALDRDYHDYRRENEDRFHHDFGSWRSQRMTQREWLNRVEEHQDVVGSDGSHIGTVDHVRGEGEGHPVAERRGAPHEGEHPQHRDGHQAHPGEDVRRRAQVVADAVQHATPGRLGTGHGQGR